MVHHQPACTTPECHHLRSRLATRCSCHHRQDIPITTRACTITRCTIPWVDQWAPILITLVIRVAITRDTTTA